MVEAALVFLLINMTTWPPTAKKLPEVLWEASTDIICKRSVINYPSTCAHLLLVAGFAVQKNLLLEDNFRILGLDIKN